MPQRVIPGETGWIDCVTNQRHTFEVVLPRLCVAFVAPDAPDAPDERAELPPGAVRLRAPGHDEVHPFSAAAEGQGGALELGFQGADDAEARYDVEVQPRCGRPYPLLSGASLGARARRPSRGAPVLARAAALHLVWRGPHAQDLPPVANKPVSLELPGVGGAPPAFHPFRTDARGRLCVAPADERPATELAWLHLPPGPRRLRLARGVYEPGQAPPSERLREVEVEMLRGVDGRDLFVARLPAPPRLSLPIQVTWPGARSREEASRAFLRDNTFDVQLDGRDVPHGAHVDEAGVIQVVFRCEAGAYELLITSRPARPPQGEAGARRVWFARRITVNDR